MNGEAWLTVSELAERFGIPQPTIRRYIERHGHHVYIKKHHKSYLISENSIPIFVRIRQGYSDGMNSDQVETLLAASGAPSIISVSAVSDHNDDRMSVSFEAVLEALNRQDEFNRMLVGLLERERMENQRQREEDRQKIDELTELIIQRNEAAAASSLLDPMQQRNDRLSERLSEYRIERKLRAKALAAWEAKPEGERLRKVGLFRKEEDASARNRFVEAYIEEHFEQSLRDEYDL